MNQDVGICGTSRKEQHFSTCKYKPVSGPSGVFANQTQRIHI
jgi:hypothetical protein